MTWRSLRRIFLSLCLFVALMAAWQTAVTVLQVPTFILPGPLAILKSLIYGLTTNLYLKHTAVTLTEVAAGYIAGLVLGLALGTIVALNRTAEYYMYPYIVMFQSMPKVALAPIIVIWFGLGLTSKIVNVALICFFPLMINTILGLRSVDDDRVNLMRSLKASDWQIFKMLRVPSALPFVMAGLEVAIVLALIGAIVAEFVGAENGLGMLIQSFGTSLDVAAQFAILVILSLIGLLLNVLVRRIGDKLLFWDPARRNRDLDAKL